jgi:hypothetical protein
MIAAGVLRALGWEVEIKEKDSYWNLVLTNTTSSMDMPESHKSCLRGLLRGWLMEFNYEGGNQQVNIYKELHGLDPEDDRYSCLDTCANRTDGNTPQSELSDREVFVRRKDRFDRYVLAEPAPKEARLVVFEHEDEADQPLTEQAAYDEYQERSGISGDRAEQLAWAMIVLLAGQLICGSKYAEFYMLGGAGLLYLLLSTLQSAWQSVTIWLVKCRIKRTGIILSDYPDWVGFGAWVFYWLKMIIIAIGAIYGASHFISFAM